MLSDKRTHCRKCGEPLTPATELDVNAQDSSASFKKTVIRVEVISSGEWEWENLSDVAHDIIEGGCSGEVKVEDVVFLSNEDTAKALITQGSDPSFLLGEKWEGWKPNSADPQPEEAKG